MKWSCCARFKQATSEDNPNIIICEDGQWNIPGCCGGGCNVIHGITHCPFCGEELPVTKSIDELLSYGMKGAIDA